MERFGRYVLLEPIATGGMAEVFRAAAIGSAGFTRAIAIKRVLGHLANDVTFVRMFIDEARMASSLSHPNIVQVLDLGQQDSAYYLAMELIAGRSLNKLVEAAHLSSMRLPIGFVFHVGSQVLQGLAHAHAGTEKRPGIIHRDVSPQNVLVSYDGNIKLTDFGIARLATPDQTMTGFMKGKPGYMSPEQANGQPIDTRVDIYAMGVVMHELIAMKRLRTDDNPVATLLEVARGHHPRFEDIGVEVPDDAAQVVYRALAFNREDRWPDAAAFAHAVDDVAVRHGWHHGPRQVAELMGQLFAKEIEAERAAQEHWRGLVEELARASTTEVTGILRRVAPAPGSQGERTQPAIAPVHRSAEIPTRRSRLWAIAGVLGMLGAGGTFAWWSAREPVPVRGALVVKTEPPGALIRVAGLERGRSPVTLEEMTPGSVDVAAELDAHKSVQRRIEVTAGQSVTTEIVLEREAPRVAVESEPAGAIVEVDGKEAGRTPSMVTLEGDREVLVTVKLDGHNPVSQRIVPSDAPPRIHVMLTREDPRRRAATPSERPAEKGTGRITLQSRPWGRIVVDGKDTGLFTPISDMKLAAGEHVIELVNDEDAVRAKFPVVVRAGSAQSINRVLE